jgi:FkbM family methyltransferase
MVKIIRSYSIDNIDLKFLDLNTSRTLEWVINDGLIKDEYGMKNISFNDNDVVLDIGANVGCISIYLAKKYPNIKIYAFEAHPINYQSLLDNIKINEVNNIITFNKAVHSKTGEILKITLNELNTGSSSFFMESQTEKYDVETISIDDIITEYKIDKLKLLKIDCEGAEFDIIEGSDKLKLIEIDTLGMEVHGFMRDYGKDFDKFYSIIENLNVKNKNIVKLD